MTGQRKWFAVCSAVLVMMFVSTAAAQAPAAPAKPNAASTPKEKPAGKKEGKAKTDAAAQPANPPAPVTAPPIRITARVESISKDRAEMVVTELKPDPSAPVSATGTLKFALDAPLQEKLKDVQVGDVLEMLVTADRTKLSNANPAPVESQPSTGMVWLVMIACGLALVVFAALATGFHPLQLIIGEDNRYSNSQFQVALWFFVGISSYMSALTLRWLSGQSGIVNIPPHLLLLSGMSALTYGAAKAVAANQTADAKAQAQDAGNPNADAAKRALAAKNPANNKPNLFRDLTRNDFGKVDIGDFQMVTVTLVAVGTYLVLLVHFLGTLTRSVAVTLPDVDTTILAAFGLGHGAYLVKKGASELGKG